MKTQTENRGNGKTYESTGIVSLLQLKPASVMRIGGLRNWLLRVFYLSPCYLHWRRITQVIHTVSSIDNLFWLWNTTPTRILVLYKYTTAKQDMKHISETDAFATDIITAVTDIAYANQIVCSTQNAIQCTAYDPPHAQTDEN
jgi:hypothetical protein